MLSLASVAQKEVWRDGDIRETDSGEDPTSLGMGSSQIFFQARKAHNAV